MTPLKESPFSFHFNMLLLMGAWTYETDDPVKENVFVAYKLLMTSLGLLSIYAFAVDFYMVMGDFKKMVWNLCVSALFTGTFGKNFQLLHRNHLINKLRMNLHRDAESRQSPEGTFLNNLAVKEHRLLNIIAYSSALLFAPIWLLTRYSKQFRELPIPMRLLVEVDFEDDRQYNLWFAVLSLCGILGVLFSLETELAMFSILMQISREYKYFLKDIPKLNDIYQSSNLIEGKEFNPKLRRLKAQVLIKQFSVRQKQLIEYTKVFELCYNQPLLQQFFMLPLLIIALAIQCMMERIDLSGNLIFQFGYLLTILIDLFLICWFAMMLKVQCHEVGETVYSTLWYGMEVEVQRDLQMIILRSQHPPKITAGKLIEMNLNTFIHKVSSMYSWIALLRQLEFKLTQTQQT